MGTVDFSPHVWATIYIILLVALLVALIVTDWRSHSRR